MTRDKDDTSPDDDGMRPDEQEGPDASEASPARCQYRQGERTDGVGESSFSADEELHESFPIEEIPTVMGADGLPEFVEPDPEQTQAIPFTWETQLCIEDDREYVEIFRQELSARGWRVHQPDQWFTPSGDEVRLSVRRRYDSEGRELERERFNPDEVQERWGVFMVPKTKKDDGRPQSWLPVRPRRERCVHLRRQVFSNDDVPDPADDGHQIVFRVCAARRSNGGAYMSLGNEGIYCCDFREPFDVPSSRLQDQKDKKKLVERPDLLKLPLFNMPGEAIQLQNEVS